MENFERTTRFSYQRQRTTDPIVTIFDGMSKPKVINLNEFGKSIITFGRDPRNDIALTSKLVSGDHGRFIRQNGVWTMEDKAAYTPSGSTNGLIYNNYSVNSHLISDGDFIRIDDGIEAVALGVLFVFSASDSANRWLSAPLAAKNELRIGRDSHCDIVLPHVTVSKFHARIFRTAGGFYIADNNSTNGVIVNNKRISGQVKLHEKDVILISNSKIIFTSDAVFYCCYRSGISVDASDIVIERKNGTKRFITCNHVNLNIKPGELVAIIGGSGAGKSTILNAMCGYLKPNNGQVYINGVNLYQNFDSLKKIVGYVPQSDIVYDNLTLHDMLMYTAKLRLPKDTTDAEYEAAISRAIATVELTEKKDSYIKAFSGGQRKRASIAVELLSDPNLLFLDEPASGLDPGTERNLMNSLRAMADGGKTVILVTHSTLQLKMCDKVVFMGKGGNLCYFGSHDDALKFFGVSDVVDVYNMITDNAENWRDKYYQTKGAPKKIKEVTPNQTIQKKNKLRQLGVLSSRYFKLVINDKLRFALLMLQAPLLAFLISLVANGDQYTTYKDTMSLFFALSCCAFWVGMLNAIQEICKERSILRREYMTGLSLGSYLSSKVVVLGVLCFVQSLLIVIVFAMCVGLPDNGILFPPFMELLITTFLTAISATAMGLMASCLFKNSDRAMTVAPILLMPQILFSGVIFPLEDASEVISYFAICRWGMEGFGTTADLNSLPVNDTTKEHLFTATTEHLFADWGLLLLCTVVCLLVARLLLSRVSKEKS